MMLHLYTAAGRHLMVNDRDEIIRTDIPGFKPSGGWLFRGLMPRLRTSGLFGFSPDKVREGLLDGSLMRYAGGSMTYKNGKPKFVIADLGSRHLSLAGRRSSEGAPKRRLTDATWRALSAIMGRSPSRNRRGSLTEKRR